MEHASLNRKLVLTQLNYHARGLEIIIQTADGWFAYLNIYCVRATHVVRVGDKLSFANNISIAEPRPV